MGKSRDLRLWEKLYGRIPMSKNLDTTARKFANHVQNA